MLQRLASCFAFFPAKNALIRTEFVGFLCLSRISTGSIQFVLSLSLSLLKLTDFYQSNSKQFTDSLFTSLIKTRMQQCTFPAYRSPPAAPSGFNLFLSGLFMCVYLCRPRHCLSLPGITECSRAPDGRVEEHSSSASWRMLSGNDIQWK